MRKTVEGDIRSVKKTKEKLIDAVGYILMNEGYHKLGINNIARKALVDKKLIYRYFGSLDELIASYLRRRDFWTKLKETVLDDIEMEFDDYGKKLSSDFLVNLFNSLKNLEETRKIILWEISEKNNDHLRKLSYEREILGRDLFKNADPWFEKSDIDLRACYAILLGGVYYLSLHSNATGGEFCGIDVRKEDGEDRIKKALVDMMELIYSRPQ